jgi:hypothetical protein
VHRLADDFPTLGFTLNGGVVGLVQAEIQLTHSLKGHALA